jgi:hypothetical protein
MFLNNYLLQGQPLNEIYKTKWKKWRRTKKKIKSDKVEHKGNWKDLRKNKCPPLDSQETTRQGKSIGKSQGGSRVQL